MSLERRPVDPTTRALIRKHLGADAKALPFIERTFSCAPSVTRVFELADGLVDSTFSGRFFRAGLPGASVYLRHARLVRTHAVLLDDTLTIKDAAALMRYGTRETLARVVRKATGVPAGRWRHDWHGDVVRRYVHKLIAPYVEELRAFDPYEGADVRSCAKSGAEGVGVGGFAR